MKTKWSDRIIKWFFGVPGVIDERIKVEIGRASIKSLIGIFIFELVFNDIIFTIAMSGRITDFESFFYLTTLIQILAVLTIIAAFTTFVLRHRGVISEDVDDKKQAIIRLKHKWLRLTPIGFILFWLLNTSLNIESQNFFVTMLNFKGIVGALVFTVLFFPIMYFYEKGNIHVIKDDNNE